jgi:hypothetical protein
MSTSSPACQVRKRAARLQRTPAASIVDELHATAKKNDFVATYASELRSGGGGGSRGCGNSGMQQTASPKSTIELCGPVRLPATDTVEVKVIPVGVASLMYGITINYAGDQACIRGGYLSFARRAIQRLVLARRRRRRTLVADVALHRQCDRLLRQKAKRWRRWRRSERPCKPIDVTPFIYRRFSTLAEGRSADRKRFGSNGVRRRRSQQRLLRQLRSSSTAVVATYHQRRRQEIAARRYSFDRLRLV